MKEVVEVQTQYCSNIDIKRICSFDYEIIDAKTKPLFHQSPRFIYIKKGQAQFLVDTELYSVGEGDLLSILPWDCTQVVEVKEDLQYAIVKYNYDLVASVLRAVEKKEEGITPVLKKIEETPVIHVDEESRPRIEYIMREIQEEVGIESVLENTEIKNYSEAYLCCLLSQMIVIFCRNIDEKKKIPRSIAPPDDKRALIFRYMYMHLGERLTLDKLSKQFYMSKSSISKYIMDQTGVPFKELLNEMRVTKTMNYLLYTDLTLEELAQILGYADAAHISKVFAARMGDKIGNYRKTYQTVLKKGNITEDKQAYKLVEYISKNFREEISAQSVADEFHMSLEGVNKILLQQVERNFYDYLNLLRINYASDLLIETDMAITDIAIDAGYNTVKTFRRNFLKWRRMTPGDFRKSMSKQS